MFKNKKRKLPEDFSKEKLDTEWEEYLKTPTHRKKEFDMYIKIFGEEYTRKTGRFDDFFKNDTIL